MSLASMVSGLQQEEDADETSTRSDSRVTLVTLDEQQLGPQHEASLTGAVSSTRLAVLL
jgi:hypothetical protein